MPLVIRNAVTDLMGQLHYGEGYVYAHDTQEKVAKMQCLPDSVADREYYRPGGDCRKTEADQGVESGAVAAIFHGNYARGRLYQGIIFCQNAALTQPVFEDKMLAC